MRLFMYQKFYIFLLLVFVLGCTKTDPISSDFTFSYSPTQCAEKWQYGESDSITIENIKKYLKENEVEIKTIAISKPDGKIYCAACICPSGRTVTIVADSTYLDKLLKLGYVKV